MLQWVSSVSFLRGARSKDGQQGGSEALRRGNVERGSIGVGYRRAECATPHDRVIGQRLRAAHLSPLSARSALTPFRPMARFLRTSSACSSSAAAMTASTTSAELPADFASATALSRVQSSARLTAVGRLREKKSLRPQYELDLMFRHRYRSRQFPKNAWNAQCHTSCLVTT